MKFSKKAFLRHADTHMKRRITKKELDCIDVNNVTFDKNDRFGRVDYEYEGEHLYLYPVQREWCE